MHWPEVDEEPYSHEQAIADGKAKPRRYMVSVPDFYFITKGNSLDDAFPRRHFKTEAAAEKAVEKLNDADAIASLRIPRTHQERFDRFRALHTHFDWTFYDHEHHPLTRLPRKPGRYAVETYYDGGTDWETYETLDEVRQQIVEDDVSRVVDLDSGEDVPFTVSVEIELPAPA